MNRCIIIVIAIIIIIIIVLIIIIIIMTRNNVILFWLTKLFRAFKLFVFTSVYSVYKFSPSVRRGPEGSVG